MANRWRNSGNSDRLYFLELQNDCRWWLHPLFQKKLAPWKKICDKSRQCIEKQRHTTLPTKVYTVKAMVFLAVIYGCESWTIKKAECWKIDALNCLVEEDSLDFLGLQRDQTSEYPKGNQYWIFIGRTHVEAPILWPPDLKSQLIGKDPDAGKG